MDCKGTQKIFWARWKYLGCGNSFTVFDILTYVKADSIVYFKYVQSIVLQLYLNKSIKTILMGIGSSLGPKSTISNNGNNLYQKDLII